MFKTKLDKYIDDPRQQIKQKKLPIICPNVQTLVVKNSVTPTKTLRINNINTSNKMQFTHSQAMRKLSRNHFNSFSYQKQDEKYLHTLSANEIHQQMNTFYKCQKQGNMSKPEYLYKYYIYVVLILNLDGYTQFIQQLMSEEDILQEYFDQNRCLLNPIDLGLYAAEIALFISKSQTRKLHVREVLCPTQIWALYQSSPNADLELPGNVFFTNWKCDKIKDLLQVCWKKIQVNLEDNNPEDEEEQFIENQGDALQQNNEVMEVKAVQIIASILVAQEIVEPEVQFQYNESDAMALYFQDSTTEVIHQYLQQQDDQLYQFNQFQQQNQQVMVNNFNHQQIAPTVASLLRNYCELFSMEHGHMQDHELEQAFSFTFNQNERINKKLKTNAPIPSRIRVVTPIWMYQEPIHGGFDSLYVRLIDTARIQTVSRKIGVILSHEGLSPMNRQILVKFVREFSPFKDFNIINDNGIQTVMGQIAPSDLPIEVSGKLKQSMTILRTQNVPGTWFYNMQQAHRALAVVILPGNQ